MPFASDVDRWLFKVGLLVAATRVPSETFSEGVLAEVAAWVLAEEEVGREPFSGLERPPSFGLQQGFWSPLGAELIERAATVQTKTARDDLDLLGQFVL